MYRQTQLDDWKTAMKIWGFHTKSHLTEFHQKGYHFIFMPWVKGMRKSTSLTKSGGWLAQRRTQHLKYILSRDVYNKYSKDTLFSSLGIGAKEKDDIILITEEPYNEIALKSNYFKEIILIKRSIVMIKRFRKYPLKLKVMDFKIK